MIDGRKQFWPSFPFPRVIVFITLLVHLICTAMYSTLICLALLTATAAPGVLASFAINDPKLTQCQNSTISWSKGTPPYDLVIVDANDPCGEPILEFNHLTSTVFDWPVGVPENALIQLYVEDAGNNDAWSGTLTVGASSDASCLSQSVLSYFNMTTPSTASDTGATSNGSPAPPSANHSSGLVPVGAANAGTNPLSSGALSMRQGTPTMLLIAIYAATIALAL